MSTNLKQTALGTSSKTKSHSLALVDSTNKKKTRHPDPLKLYKRDAQKIIALLYEQDTPDFITDLLQDYLTELESLTQVFWNRREILEVALPLMFQEADAMGIDYLGTQSDVMRGAISAMHGRDDSHTAYREPTEREQLLRDIKADAEALARILNSPRIPPQVQNTLADYYNSFVSDFTEEPEVVREQWTLAALKFCAEQK